MASETIVEHFNVLKNIRLSFGPGGVMTMINLFGFQRTDTTFHRRIIVAIALTAHTNLKLMLGQQGLIVMAGILAAPVRMMDQARRRLAGFKRHLQGVTDQRAG